VNLSQVRRERLDLAQGNVRDRINYYAAFVADLDGNWIEAVRHGAASCDWGKMCRQDAHGGTHPEETFNHIEHRFHGFTHATLCLRARGLHQCTRGGERAAWHFPGRIRQAALFIRGTTISR
jgi:hypothetical protein